MSDQAPTKSAPRKAVMRKKEVVQAILATQNAISALPKTERNNYGQYNYATIDQFYETVATTARRNGLTWVVSEDEVVVGRDSTLHRYVVELQYKDGTTFPEYARLSVLHPLMGAQATGSAMSYAEKVFMRMVFKVPTGEFDADATDGKNVRTGGVRGRRGGRVRGSPPEARSRDLGPIDEPDGISGSGEVMYGYGGLLEDENPPPPYPEEDAPKSVNPDEATEAAMVAFARSASTTAALNAYWKEQQHTLKSIQQRDPARIDRITKAFRDQKAMILAKSQPPVQTAMTAPAVTRVPPPQQGQPRAATRTLRAPVI